MCWRLGERVGYMFECSTEMSFAFAAERLGMVCNASRERVGGRWRGPSGRRLRSSCLGWKFRGTYNMHVEEEEERGYSSSLDFTSEY